MKLNITAYKNIEHSGRDNEPIATDNYSTYIHQDSFTTYFDYINKFSYLNRDKLEYYFPITHLLSGVFEKGVNNTRNTENDNIIFSIDIVKNDVCLNSYNCKLFNSSYKTLKEYFDKYNALKHYTNTISEEVKYKVFLGIIEEKTKAVNNVFELYCFSNDTLKTTSETDQLLASLPPSIFIAMVLEYLRNDTSIVSDKIIDTLRELVTTVKTINKEKFNYVNGIQLSVVKIENDTIQTEIVTKELNKDLIRGLFHFVTNLISEDEYSLGRKVAINIRHGNDVVSLSGYSKSNEGEKIGNYYNKLFNSFILYAENDIDTIKRCFTRTGNIGKHIGLDQNIVLEYAYNGEITRYTGLYDTIYKKTNVCLQFIDKATNVGVEYQLPKMYLMHLYGIGIIHAYPLTNTILVILDENEKSKLLEYVRDDVNQLPESEKQHLKKIHQSILNVGEFDLYILVSFDEYKYRMKIDALSSILP